MPHITDVAWSVVKTPLLLRCGHVRMANQSMSHVMIFRDSFTHPTTLTVLRLDHTSFIPHLLNTWNTALSTSLNYCFIIKYILLWVLKFLVWMVLSHDINDVITWQTGLWMVLSHDINDVITWVLSHDINDVTTLQTGQHVKAHNDPME